MVGVGNGYLVDDHDVVDRSWLSLELDGGERIERRVRGGAGGICVSQTS